MKKLFVYLLPLIMMSQTIDSIEVKFTNPEGSAVQGVPQGYSKIIIQTVIAYSTNQ